MAVLGNPPTIPGDPRMDLPMIPRRGVQGDGTEPIGQQGTDGDEGTPQQPTLATASDTLTFQAIDMLVRSQDRIARNRFAIDLHHRRADDGILGRLYKIPNQNIWEAKLPPGMSRECSAATPNKLKDLCNKVTDTIEADPARPDPVVPDNDTSAESAAEIAADFLRELDSATGIDSATLWRWSLRNALVASSSFIEYEATEDGGGYQPYQVLAHPGATDPQHPMVALDPATGLQLPSVDPILRYVSPDDQFVEDASQADRVWLPGIRAHMLRREQVRCFPLTAKTERASAVILLKWCTLAEALKMPGWDGVKAMNSGDLSQLASWRTPYPNMIVPPAFITQADGQSGPGVDQVGSLSPLLQRRMYFYRLYVKAGKEEYENGLHVDVTGMNGGTILFRGTMDYTAKLPGDEGTVSRCRGIPVVQETPEEDITGGDPMGFPFANRVSGSTEASSTLMAAYLDATDMRLHPHVFIRSTTTIDEDDWNDRETPISLSPDSQEPTYEQFPAMPDVLQSMEFLYQADDSAASLGETAQGLETDTSVSGVAKSITVQQARIGLSGIQQRHNAAKVRAWKICLEIAQAKFTQAQLLRSTGAGGSGAVQWWTGDDLAGIDDIGIEPGTGTMMTPEGKAQYVAYAQQQQWITPQEAGPLAMSGISRDLGLPPDPVEQAVERAMDTWLEGPPNGWTQAKEAQVQQLQAFQQHQAQSQQTVPTVQQPGQPVPPPPPQLAPLFTPFTPRANDGEPAVAAVWFKKLSRLLMLPAYTAEQDPNWRALVDQRYQAAAQAIQAAQQPGKAPPKNQADATYEQFIQDVTQRAVSLTATDIAKTITAPLAPPPTQTGRVGAPTPLQVMP